MTYCINAALKIPYMATVTKEIKMLQSYEVSIIDKLTDVPRMFMITTDAWPYRVYSIYLSLTLHLIGKRWNMRHVLLDILRFQTHHNRTTTSTLSF